MIKIIEDTYLDADTNNYEIFEWNGRKDKNGSIKKQNVRYYATIESAIAGLINRLTRKAIGKQEVADLQELLAKIKKLNQTVKDAVSLYKDF